MFHMPMSISPLFIMLIFFTQSLRRKNIIMLLLLLESYIILITLLLFYMATNFAPWFLFILLLFAACEAALGLSLMVAIVRLSGATSVNSLTALKC